MNNNRKHYTTKQSTILTKNTCKTNEPLIKTIRQRQTDNNKTYKQH